MRSSLLSFASAAALCLSAAAAASAATAPDDARWVVRARATYLSTQDKSDGFSALGINFASDAVKVSDKWIPEIDVAYRFTPRLWAELVLTIPQEHTVDLAGVGELGTFKHLPPTFLAQWHFMPEGPIDPYVGAGLNLTLIMDTELRVPGTTVDLELDDVSVGPAAQAGVDITLGSGLYLNVDFKWAMIRSDVSVKGGGKLTEARLDPWMGSVGIAWHF